MKKTRRAFIALAVIAAFLTVLDIFLAVWWFGFSYPAFYKMAEEGPRIPGLSSGISPQGLCLLPENGRYRFAMSGYISGKPSRVYLLREDPAADKKQTEFYVTFTENGEDIRTHFGGVTCSDAYMYIASGKKIIRISLEKIFSADNAARIEIDGSFLTGLDNAFCYIYGGKLYAGEFYRSGNYENDPSHHLETAGGMNYAFVYEFSLDEQAAGGVAKDIPDRVISVRKEVQGFAITDSKIYLSCSYGLPDSKLFVYENGTAEGTMSVSGTEVPLLVLGGENLLNTVKMPCMSEEICVQGDHLVVLFESMSLKYRYVVHHRISTLLSLPLSSLG